MGFALTHMQLTSTAFADGERIPTKHTGEGEDVSPALAWTKPPGGTKHFALVCHDPDAPLIKPATYGFVHWVLYGIPGSVTGLAEGASDYIAGANDFGKQGYGGPMPPENHGTHRYFFWLFALKSGKQPGPGLTMWQLLEKIEPDVIGMNRLMGTYSR
ncbi:MAG: YbhB/YbcL family Raf kinase inhibitor-like protein [Woeseiaceae bacterium]|nr:YbhB/YbcL family Raf kinase inhibitor-like protein [Woeseiaceae bacterium]